MIMVGRSIPVTRAVFILALILAWFWPQLVEAYLSNDADIGLIEGAAR